MWPPLKTALNRIKAPAAAPRKRMSHQKPPVASASSSGEIVWNMPGATVQRSCPFEIGIVSEVLAGISRIPRDATAIRLAGYCVIGGGTVIASVISIIGARGALGSPTTVVT